MDSRIIDLVEVAADPATVAKKLYDKQPPQKEYKAAGYSAMGPSKKTKTSKAGEGDKKQYVDGDYVPRPKASFSLPKHLIWGGRAIQNTSNPGKGKWKRYSSGAAYKDLMGGQGDH